MIYLLACHCKYRLPFPSSLTLHYIVILKFRTGVTEGHFKWHHLTDHIWAPIVFRCNYGDILYCFRNKASYWSQTLIFHAPFHLTALSPRSASNFFLKLWHKLLESLNYQMVKNIAEKFNSLSRVHQRHRRQTDRRTELRWHKANVT